LAEAGEADVHAATEAAALLDGIERLGLRAGGPDGSDDADRGGGNELG